MPKRTVINTSNEEIQVRWLTDQKFYGQVWWRSDEQPEWVLLGDIVLHPESRNPDGDVFYLGFSPYGSLVKPFQKYHGASITACAKALYDNYFSLDYPRMTFRVVGVKSVLSKEKDPDKGIALPES